MYILEYENWVKSVESVKRCAKRHYKHSKQLYPFKQYNNEELDKLKEFDFYEEYIKTNKIFMDEDNYLVSNYYEPK